MKKIIASAFILIISTVAAFAGERRIAFERSDAVYVANLDGTAEKKIADGIFPAISPDGTTVAFNTVEKNDTTYVRHIAVVEIATGKTAVFKDVPSDNSYYPTWSPDGKRILFTLRQNEVWDLALINADGTDFRALKKGDPNEVTRYSPIWARDGQSIFCQDMTNIYRLRSRWRGARSMDHQQDYSEWRHERRWPDRCLAGWETFASWHRYGRGIPPQRLGRPSPRLVDIRP
jgi:dipeptidyl aminopeptidase/acylaminoacyl peptidase